MGPIDPLLPSSSLLTASSVREDISQNLHALEDLHAQFNTQLLLIESGGDNLAANYSRELADFIIYVVGKPTAQALISSPSFPFSPLRFWIRWAVRSHPMRQIDVSGGDKIPRKGGPGITQSDLLIVNKTDLAELVGADLDVMDSDARKMREGGPTIFAEIKNGKNVQAIVDLVLSAWRASGASGPLHAIVDRN